MTAPLPREADVDVHTVLIGLSSRLESLWEHTCAAATTAGGDGPGPDGWETAAQRLVAAMAALEGYAGRLDPDLGRRDWRSRDVTPGTMIPAQRDGSR